MPRRQESGTDLRGPLLLNGSAGVAGQVPQSAGPGAIPTWGSPAASAGGSTTEVNYNNGGVLDGAVNVKIKSDNLQLTEPGTAPGAADASSLLVYPVAVANRYMAAMRGPLGSVALLQPSLFSNSICMFNPQSGTVGTGGNAFQTAWTPGGTISHPATLASSIAGSMRTTRFANVITTANQALGVRMAVASDKFFSRGSTAGAGGFFFFARFVCNTLPAGTVRLFAGLHNAANTSVITADTLTTDTCGLRHITTDPLTGAGALNFCIADNTGFDHQSTGLDFSASNAYEFAMYAPPNHSEIYFRLENLTNPAVATWTASAGRLPRNNQTMQPQVGMSNGTVHTAANAVTFDIARIYGESHY